MAEIEAIKAAQKLLDEIMTTRPYCEYAKSHNLKLLDDRLSLMDKLLDQGIIKVTEANRCDCTRF